MLGIFESHAHFDDEAFDGDREELISSLPLNGIEYVINVGSNLKTSKKSLDFADKYPFIYAAVGAHPDDVRNLDDAKITRIRQLAKNEKCVAIGEVGLDYHYENDDETKYLQAKYFKAQLDIAKEEKLPVIVHSRDAANDNLTIMKEYPSLGGVIHCFSYSLEIALEYIKMGYHIGVGGAVTFKNSKKLCHVVENIPLEKILLETDCPYMAPVPFRGKRNSSLYLPYVVQKIAEIKDVSPQTVIEVTNKNAREVFFKKDRIIKELNHLKGNR
ncbi:TatD DNase family protein [Acetitomaculum ruminis DSM 5522]|uniref:TatD DNase family protein n=1 Tax=Acetitomaculum ruminis DSM 5522 TaxID=1120918 RepID=A0A1I0ZB02_9FIRM|nr:TatD family hydrolase [Acetitomaculum ruminis]SFB22824.1 TatD DNase family protein [Acetitomaculum ruminis DSM 5522]